MPKLLIKNDLRKPVAWLPLTLVTCVLLVQVPIVNTVVEQPRALSLGAWDWRTLTVLCVALFVIIPFAVWVFHKILSNVIGNKSSYIIFSLIFAFVFTNQISIEILNIETRIEKIFLLVPFLLITVVVYFVRPFLERILLPFVISSICLCMYLVVMTAPTNSYSIEPSASQSTLPKYVFFLTFEKLSWRFLSDRNGNDVDEAALPELHRFASKADLFLDAHSTSSQTYLALRSLYTGRYLGARQPGYLHSNVLSTMQDSHSVVFMNEVNTALCDPAVHRCVSSMGGISDSRRVNLIESFFKTWILTSYPPLGNTYLYELDVGSDKWQFEPFMDLWTKEMEAFGDVESRSADDIFYDIGHRQFDHAAELLNTSGTEHMLFILHSFMTDSPEIDSGAFEMSDIVSQQISKHKLRLNIADKAFGEFLDILKNKGIYDDSLIVVTSDTAYASEFWKSLANPKVEMEKFENFPEFSQVFLAIKWPGQKQGSRVTKQVSLVDIYPTILKRYTLEFDKTEYDGRDLYGPEISPLKFLHYITGGGERIYELGGSEWNLSNDQN